MVSHSDITMYTFHVAVSNEQVLNKAKQTVSVSFNAPVAMGNRSVNFVFNRLLFQQNGFKVHYIL